MKATRLPYFTAAFWKTGNSARHGPHHDAHLFTTTGYPRSFATRLWNSCGPPSSSWLRWSYSERSGGGAPAKARSAAGPVLALPPPEPEEPLVSRTMPTTATSAVTARTSALVRIGAIPWHTRTTGLRDQTESFTCGKIHSTSVDPQGKRTSAAPGTLWPRGGDCHGEARLADRTHRSARTPFAFPPLVHIGKPRWLTPLLS